MHGSRNESIGLRHHSPPPSVSSIKCSYRSVYISLRAILELLPKLRALDIMFRFCIRKDSHTSISLTSAKSTLDTAPDGNDPTTKPGTQLPTTTVRTWPNLYPFPSSPSFQYPTSVSSLADREG